MKGRVLISSSATHFKCGGCETVRPVRDGAYKASVAVNKPDQFTGLLAYYVHEMIVCEGCYNGQGKGSEDNH